MILKSDELISMPEFRGTSPETLIRKLDAVEALVRSYTHNNFQNRSVRFEAASDRNILHGTSPFLVVGDTIQISQSQVNDGLYNILELREDAIMINKALFPVAGNLVTKVEYPQDIQDGVINLLLWEKDNRQKVGVKSETLSRHSVTYYDLDTNNQIMGYPVSLLGFLKPYMKARF